MCIWSRQCCCLNTQSPPFLANTFKHLIIENQKHHFCRCERRRWENLRIYKDFLHQSNIITSAVCHNNDLCKGWLNTLNPHQKLGPATKTNQLKDIQANFYCRWFLWTIPLLRKEENSWFCSTFYKCSMRYPFATVAIFKLWMNFVIHAYLVSTVSLSQQLKLIQCMFLFSTSAWHHIMKQ